MADPMTDPAVVARVAELQAALDRMQAAALAAQNERDTARAEAAATVKLWTEHVEKVHANHHETQILLSAAEKGLARQTVIARAEYERRCAAERLAAGRQTAIERLTEQRDAARRQVLELNARLLDETEAADA
ncbi:hypothetical protein [Actinomadura rubrisoli]|uniref:Uncharacterized protein n=1 Tax=Actinomadura rubrisoli TaxID=2530368 RepID=A0A4R5CC64_9ACTN|nr:hypothetical protein [Actinomadura rubrisoli]TDD97568.1 hypothetical protein E1298_00630 [Actinomadura rubrisoli]